MMMMMKRAMSKQVNMPRYENNDNDEEKNKDKEYIYTKGCKDDLLPSATV